MVASLFKVLAIIAVGDQVKITEAKEVKNVREQKSIILPANFVFKNLESSFDVELTVYCMTVQAVPESRPKQKNNLKLFSSKFQGFKRMGSKDEKMASKSSINPALFSPGGPNAVRKSNFRVIGRVRYGNLSN